MEVVASLSRLWLLSLKVAQLLRSAACLHTNQSRSYLNHLVFTRWAKSIRIIGDPNIQLPGKWSTGVCSLGYVLYVWYCHCVTLLLVYIISV